MTTRRQFLNRSAWGFGSAFILPSLLASCTDHLIDPTNPTPPVISPPLTDDGEDWHSQVRAAITTGLRILPEVGNYVLVSALADIVWPSSGPNPWDQIRTATQAVTGQAFSDSAYNGATKALKDLQGLIADFKTEIDKGTTGSMMHDKWGTIYTAFVGHQTDFQAKGSEVQLLPFFAQYVNLFLSLLDDEILHAKEWGFTLDETETYGDKIGDLIKTSTDYVNTWCQSGRVPLANKKVDYDAVEPFRSTNAYDRHMTLLVLDYMDAWPYYDMHFHPYGARDLSKNPLPLFTRELYSDPYGNLETSSIYSDITGDQRHPTMNLPSPATQFPTQLTIWSGSRLDAVQLTYPAGGGPGGVTQTARMGDSNGGSAQVFTLAPDNPITQVQVAVWPAPVWNTSKIISAIQCKLKNGAMLPLLGTSDPYVVGADSGWIGYGNYALSSVYIQGENPAVKDSVNCIVFGFKRWPLV